MPGTTDVQVWYFSEWEQMREIFVTELVREVLGPRRGISEIMDSSPLTEYITGVLAPITGQSVPETTDPTLMLSNTRLTFPLRESPPLPYAGNLAQTV